MNIKVEREILTVLLEKVKNGQIAVPKFQRDFIWTAKQITEFFDSILRGYPIGSLILWMPEKDHFNTYDNLEGISIQKEKHYEIWYILDGRQRITTLLSTLYEEGYNSHKYYVDLDDKHIIHWNKGTRPSKMNLLCLSEAFDSFALVGYLEQLNKSRLSEETKKKYAIKAKEINKILMSYEISYTIVRGGYIADAVEIFSRLNSKTTLISTDYMIQALAYEPDDDFLFADAITDIKNNLDKYGFSDLSRDAILKCIYNYTDKYFVDGKAEDLLKMKDKLREITKQVKIDTELAAHFLNQDCHVVSSKLLPYIYQFVMLSLFFKYNRQYSDNQRNLLKKWFFYTTYSAYFTNTSLGEIRKSLQKFHTFCEGKSNSPIQYEEEVIIPELSSAFSLNSVRYCAFVLSQIHHLPNFNCDNGIDVYTIPETGKRMAGNAVICFCPSDKTELYQLFNGTKEWEKSIEEKYFISDDLIQQYHNGKYSEFCSGRLNVLQQNEKQFVENLFSTENIQFLWAGNEKMDTIDYRLKNLLNWLQHETDWYITHPFDIDRLNEIANLIAKEKIPFKNETVMNYCESIHWPTETSRQIVNSLKAAQEKTLQTMNRINREQLLEIMTDYKNNEGMS